MHPFVRSFLAFVGVIAVAASIFLLLPKTSLAPVQQTTDQPDINMEATPVSSKGSSPSTTPTKTTTTSKIPVPAKAAPISEAIRITNPYPFPPPSTESVTRAARAALVNIFCISSNRTFKSVSGSGVVIDPRGVILTNAHVAQYVLLSARPELGISCTVRSGAPAIARWRAQVLYIPPIWVQSHASEILYSKTASAGEHDYSLLLITGSVDNTTTSPFPFLPVDVREAVAFPGDQILVASYPAEFLGGVNAQFNLHPVSSITTIGQLYAFFAETADIFSLGSIIEAQSGSSGGAAVNMWGHLVGLVTATSDGETTADRDLRALSMSYVNRDIAVQTGLDLAQILTGDVAAYAIDFNARISPILIALYLPHISL